MKVLIVEDITLVAERIADMCERFLEKPDTIIAHTLADASRHIDQAAFDLVLLDLNLNGQDGFDLLENIKAEPLDVIVITASPERAVDAFDVGVLDFIAKPISENRFGKAIGRFLERRVSPKQIEAHLLVKSMGQVTILQFEGISYIEASGNYAQIHTHSGTNHLYDNSLDGLLACLPDSFLRVHRSYAVPLENIEKINRHGAGKYSAILKSSDIIPVSRGCYKRQFS